MDDIEDYDETIQHLVKQIEKFLKFADKKGSKSNDGDKSNFLVQIKRNTDKMKEQLKYLKSEIYKIPKDQEAKYRTKYLEY